MIPTVSLPNIQAPPPVPASLFQAAPALPAAGRLPQETVGGMIASAETNPQGRGGAQAIPGAPPATITGTPGFAERFAAALASPSAAVNFGASTPFLAQLLGQSPGAQGEQLAAFFSGQAKLTLADYDALAQVKYRPSEAGLPPPPPASFRYVEPPPPPGTAPVYVTAALSRQREKEVAETESAPAPAYEEIEAVLAAARSEAVPLLPAAPLLERKETPASLIGGRGPGAYEATAARNQLQLAPPKAAAPDSNAATPPPTP